MEECWPNKEHMLKSKHHEQNYWQLAHGDRVTTYKNYYGTHGRPIALLLFYH
jgi:hypothetical protein